MTPTAESRAHFRALGIRLAQLRKTLDVTPAELARILGVSQQTVFAYELGERRMSVLMLIKLTHVDVLLEMNASASSVTSK